MKITPDTERRRRLSGEGAAEAVSVAFADLDARVYGVARIGLTTSGASALAVLCADREPVAVRAVGEPEPPAEDWDELAVAGVACRTREPLRAWSFAFADDAGLGCELELEALAPPAALPDGGELGSLTRAQGYEQLCRVTGTAELGGGQRRRVDCLGQRGHSWGTPSWDAVGVTRTVSAWLPPARGVMLQSARPAGVEGHEHDAIAALAIEPRDGGPPRAGDADEPRLSTTYDGDGRPRSAGLEVYPSDESELPWRLAGRTVCGTTLELGRLTLELAWLEWRLEGARGGGRYELVRRTE